MGVSRGMGMLQWDNRMLDGSGGTVGDVSSMS